MSSIGYAHCVFGLSTSSSGEGGRERAGATMDARDLSLRRYSMRSRSAAAKIATL